MPRVELVHGSAGASCQENATGRFYGNLLFINAIPVDVTEAGLPMSSTELSFEQQARAVIAKLWATLQRDISTPPGFLSVKAYIVGAQHAATFYSVFAEVLGSVRMRPTVIPVGKLPHGCLIELEAVAARR